MKFNDHLLVLLQFLAIALCCYPTASIRNGNYSFLIISAVGLVGSFVTLFYNKPGNFRINPGLKSSAKLITAGPYRVVRHPMYLCLALIMLGISLFNFSYRTLAGLILVIIAISLKAYREERYLLESFSGYRDYLGRTKRLIPWVW